MYWFFTCLFTGVLLSIGWRIGAVAFEWVRIFIEDAEFGIKRIKRYKQKQNMKHDRMDIRNKRTRA